MKNLLLAFLLLGFVMSCTQEEENPIAIGEVTFKSVSIESFSGNLPNSRVSGPSSWKHIFKDEAVMQITNTVTGQEYSFPYNPNLFGEGVKFPLPFGSYSYKTSVEGGAFEKFLPFSAEGEFTLSETNLEVYMNATTEYGLITVKNELVKTLGIRHGDELCEFGLLSNESFYYLYAKMGQVAMLEIVESYTGTLITREIDIQAYNHYNFILKLKGDNGMVNFIELALGEFDYVEEYIEFGSNPSPRLILWNKLGSFSEIMNSEFGPDLFPGGAMLFDEGKFGGGLYVPQGSGVSYDHSPYGPINIIPLDAFAIEFWYKRNQEPDAGGHGFFTPIYGRNEGISFVGVSGYDGYDQPEPEPGNMWRIGASIQDNNQVPVGNYYFDLQNQENWEVFFPKDDWIHLAICHDASWPVGERVKIFRDGNELTGLIVEDDTGYMGHLGKFVNVPFQIGNFNGWDFWGAGGIIDNLKIWNYAKTDFSDRENEGN